MKKVIKGVFFLLLVLSLSLTAAAEVAGENDGETEMPFAGVLEETEEEIIFSLDSGNWVIENWAEAEIIEVEEVGTALQVTNVGQWGDDIFFYFGDENKQADLSKYSALKFDIETDGHMVQVGIQGFEEYDEEKEELYRSWGDFNINVIEDQWTEVEVRLVDLLEAQEDYETLESLEEIVNIVIKGAGSRYTIANFRLVK